MSIVDGVSKFAREVHELAQDKGWWDDCACEEPGKVTVERRGKHEHPIWTFHPLQGVDIPVVLSKLALIHSEVSEAVEAVRDGKFQCVPELDKHDQWKPEGLEAELADIVIRVLDLGEALGLNVPAAMVEKHEFNKIREHRHGGRLA